MNNFFLTPSNNFSQAYPKPKIFPTFYFSKVCSISLPFCDSLEQNLPCLINSVRFKFSLRARKLLWSTKRKWYFLTIHFAVFLGTRLRKTSTLSNFTEKCEIKNNLDLCNRVRHDWSDLACMHALEKEMATHSSILAWRIPGTEEPDGLPSMGSHRVGHNWSDLAAAAAADLCNEFFFFF